LIYFVLFFALSIIGFLAHYAFFTFRFHEHRNFTHQIMIFVILFASDITGSIRRYIFPVSVIFLYHHINISLISDGL